MEVDIVENSNNSPSTEPHPLSDSAKQSNNSAASSTEVDGSLGHEMNSPNPIVNMNSPMYVDSPVNSDSPAASEENYSLSPYTSQTESPSLSSASESKLESDTGQHANDAAKCTQTKKTFLCSECGCKIPANSSCQKPPCPKCLSPSHKSDEDDVQNKVSPKKKRERSSAGTLKFPPCFVCSGLATGLHYGVNSCEACKGFFRRSLMRSEEIKCTKNGNCQTTNKSRGNCPACRLAKCRSLGMSKCASRLGRYSVSMRTKTILEVKKLETPAKSDDKTFADFRCDYETLVNKLVDAMDTIKPFGDMSPEEMEKKMKDHYKTHKAKEELFGKMKAIPDEDYYHLLKEYGIDADGRMECLRDSKKEIEDSIAMFVSFAKKIPGFITLPIEDQSNLLKVGRFDFFMILLHQGYDVESQVFLEYGGKPYHLEECADKFFSRELINGIVDLYMKWRKLNPSREETALLLALSLTFQDRCKLENRVQVDSMQEFLAEALWKCIQKSRENTPVQQFARIMDCFLAHRVVAESYFKEYKELCRQELVIDEVPMINEFVLDEW